MNRERLARLMSRAGFAIFGLVTFAFACLLVADLWEHCGPLAGSFGVAMLVGLTLLCGSWWLE